MKLIYKIWLWFGTAVLVALAVIGILIKLIWAVVVPVVGLILWFPIAYWFAYRDGNNKLDDFLK